MTILDCIKDQFYGEEKARDLIDDLIKIINHEILSLAKHGCKNIHLDEPVLMRYPEKALDYGVKDVIKCFEGKISISFISSLNFEFKLRSSEQLITMIYTILYISLSID